MINLNPEYFARRIHSQTGLLWEEDQSYALRRGQDILNEQIENIARLCHAANLGICDALGDHSQLGWEDTSKELQESVISGVKAHLANPDLTPAQSHQLWFDYKQAEGWVYGPVKNLQTKEHPCMLPYMELPVSQKLKDFVFKNIVAEAAQQIL